MLVLVYALCSRHRVTISNTASSMSAVNYFVSIRLNGTLLAWSEMHRDADKLSAYESVQRHRRKDLYNMRLVQTTKNRAWRRVVDERLSKMEWRIQLCP